MKLQVSHTPGQKIALGGVVLALTGLLALAVHPAPADLGRGRVATVGVPSSRSPGSTAAPVGTCRWRSTPSPMRSVRRQGPDSRTRPQQVQRVQESRRDPRAVRGAQQPGRRCLRRRLLPRRAGAPRPVGGRAQGPGEEPVGASDRGAATPRSPSRSPARRPQGQPATSRTSPSGWSSSAGSASRSRWSRRSCTSSPSWRVAWPRTRCGCPGETCTSSSSPAPGSSSSATCCSTAATRCRGSPRS